MIGEQVPKIYGIRRPETLFLWCAVPLKWFYLSTYPFMILLNSSANFILKKIGIEGAGHHETPVSEEEIRGLLSISHAKGELTRSEHKLLNAVFEFDDEIIRRIMVPLIDVVYIDNTMSLTDVTKLVKRTKHTRIPFCKGSLENVLGVIHIKDLVGLDPNASADLSAIARKPEMIPETTPISKLLHHFQSTRNHLAFVIEEHGGVVGIVTLENVLEKIVGSIQDEFDNETPLISPDGEGKYIVLGNTTLTKLNNQLDLELYSDSVDTISGLMVERQGRLLKVGDKVKFGDAKAEVLELKGNRVFRIRLILPVNSDTDPGSEKPNNIINLD